MDEQTQLPYRREVFCRRERRSIPIARAFARDALDGWGWQDRAADVLLCVSELATNALLHGVPPGRGFRLHLIREGETRLRVELHDSGPGEIPSPDRPPSPYDESGRGLLLVEACADKWGVADRRPGKTVWCTFDR
ncbi:ATP-binding protein [Streptomyces sp. NPDC050738]|uniref:ATP-binding protein n=1 Tax=Streptomyces sp. NPDC050738 TaxID=3154744 RepID=UPI00342D24B1